MVYLDLKGEWQFKSACADNWLKASVPGCNYTDLMGNGVLQDPFFGCNEVAPEVREVAYKDFEYKKTFYVDPELLKNEVIELIADGIDTIAQIFINDQSVLDCSNAFIRYEADIKQYLKDGENTIYVYFKSPVKYVEEKKAAYKHNLMKNTAAMAHAQYIRKPQYSFGWDWGPQLPLSGISGDIFIRAYKKARLGSAKISQTHCPDNVQIDLDTQVLYTQGTEGDLSKFTLKVELVSPTGELILEDCEVVDGKANTTLCVKNPMLWQPNGSVTRKEQPLYRLNLYLLSGDTVFDKRDYSIGLRTIELDLSPADWGSRFSFKVNGRSIFAKGANWIPADSFINRVSASWLDYLIKNMRDIGFNMIRVWGGGYYESQTFYDLCDKYGILVWQDCAFACQPYPLTDESFVEGVRDEVLQNVERIRHRASLALLCGNNELEQMATIWRFNAPLKDATQKFFYETLPEWIRQKDTVTPYWASSPSGGECLKGVNDEGRGDTHLWRVWHGLSPYEYYKKVYTNFCSEFGMQSLPTLNTIKKFAKPEDYDLNSPVMLNHQKNGAGNSLMKYYLTADFISPKNFVDLIYLTQIIQGKCMEEPVEHWRRNFGRCMGALYWQYNDCWPVSSWASIDYYGNYKALQYFAKRFFAPLLLSLEKTNKSIRIHVVNETSENIAGEINWRIEKFSGEAIASGELSVKSNTDTATFIAEIDYKGLIKTHGKECVFVAELIIDGKVVSKRTALFTKEKNLTFDKAKFDIAIVSEVGKAWITLKTNTFARYVFVRIDGLTEPLSDNFFDMTAMQEKTVEMVIPTNWDADMIKKHLTVISLCDIEHGATKLQDKLYRFKVNIKPVSIVKRIGYALGI